MTIKAVVFDAYGTLFDVYAVTARLQALCPGQGGAIAQLWRDKQIEYSRLISLSDPCSTGSRYYISFWEITRKALAYALARFNIALQPHHVDGLLRQYEHLDAFPENHAVLSELQHRHIQTAILSNGNAEMLLAAVRHAGFDALIGHCLSVDQIRHFKTMPQAYDLVQQHLNVSAEHVLFVSGNGWDVLAAQWYGFQTCWINRAGLPVETLDVAPHYQGRDLSRVLEAIEQLNAP
jgi:2-haloacid dehalogenase